MGEHKEVFTQSDIARHITVDTIPCDNGEKTFVTVNQGYKSTMILTGDTAKGFVEALDQLIENTKELA